MRYNRREAEHAGELLRASKSLKRCKPLFRGPVVLVFVLAQVDLDAQDFCTGDTARRLKDALERLPFLLGLHLDYLAERQFLGSEMERERKRL